MGGRHLSLLAAGAVAFLCVPMAGALMLPAAAHDAVDGWLVIHQAAGQRVIAIGDIHGALDSFTRILQEVELIDDDLHWIGGNTILVQTGDYTDRGPEVRGTMDLLMRLQQEAPEQGGRVLVTLANHEAMNLVNFYRDTSPADYAAFVDGNSEKRQDEAFAVHVALRKKRAELLHDDEPKIDRDEWEQSHPLGYVERLEAFGPDGYYGRWLRERPTAVRLGDVLFMHAGINPELAKLDVDEINERIWNEIELFDRTRRDMVDAELITPHADLVEIITGADEELVRFTEQYAPERGVHLSRQQEIQARQLRWVLGYQKWDVLSADGLLWFRGLAQWPEDEHLDDIERILERQHIAYIVAGHTTQTDGVIKARFGGRVFIIDTGMLVEFYAGRPAALEISDGTFTAIYVDERTILHRQGAAKLRGSLSAPG